MCLYEYATAICLRLQHRPLLSDSWLSYLEVVVHYAAPRALFSATHLVNHLNFGAAGAPSVCVGSAMPGARGVGGGLTGVWRHLLPVRRPTGEKCKCTLIML